MEEGLRSMVSIRILIAYCLRSIRDASLILVPDPDRVVQRRRQEAWWMRMPWEGRGWEDGRPAVSIWVARDEF